MWVWLAVKLQYILKIRKAKLEAVNETEPMQAMYLDDSELPTRSRYAEVKRKFQFHDGQIFDQWRDSTCVRLDKALSLHVHVYFQSQNERKHPEKNIHLWKLWMSSLGFRLARCEHRPALRQPYQDRQTKHCPQQLQLDHRVVLMHYGKVDTDEYLGNEDQCAAEYLHERGSWPKKQINNPFNYKDISVPNLYSCVERSN